jgi:phage tail-like protein
MDIVEYPSVGFHFMAEFELLPKTSIDMMFQEVSGLNVTIETESFREGGENRFSHQLPKGLKFSDLTFKRGKIVGSSIVEWCKEAIHNFEFKPTNVTISLLNDQHVPVSAWYVVNAFPVEWSVSGFNANENSLVMETIKLKYNFFKSLNV